MTRPTTVLLLMFFTNSSLFFVWAQELLPEPEQIVGIKRDVEALIIVPYMVGIQISTTKNVDHLTTWNYQCGGAIISNRWIITAAHCFYDCRTNTRIPDHRFRIFYNTLKHFQLDIIINRTVAIHIINDDFDCDNAINDLALIQLESPIDLGRGGHQTQAIQLNRKFTVRTHDTVRLYGFGFGSGDMLKAADLEVYEKERCRHRWQKYNMPIHDSEFCTFAELSNSAHGDSGSPLIFQRKTQFFLAGVVSRGYKQDKENSVNPIELPGVNTDIRSHIQWIDGVIEKYSPKNTKEYLADKIRHRKMKNIILTTTESPGLEGISSTEFQNFVMIPDNEEDFPLEEKLDEDEKKIDQKVYWKRIEYVNTSITTLEQFWKSLCPFTMGSFAFLILLILIMSAFEEFLEPTEIFGETAKDADVQRCQRHTLLKQAFEIDSKEKNNGEVERLAGDEKQDCYEKQEVEEQGSNEKQDSAEEQEVKEQGGDEKQDNEEEHQVEEQKQDDLENNLSTSSSTSSSSTLNSSKSSLDSLSEFRNCVIV